MSAAVEFQSLKWFGNYLGTTGTAGMDCEVALLSGIDSIKPWLQAYNDNLIYGTISSRATVRVISNPIWAKTIMGGGDAIAKCSKALLLRDEINENQ